MKNRSGGLRSVSDRFGDAPGHARDAPGTLQDVPGAFQDTPGAAQESSRERSGHSKIARKRSQSAPEAPRNVQKRSPVPFVSPNALRNCRRSFFLRFRLVARKLRSEFRPIFTSVLSMSDDFRVARVSHRKTSKKRPFWLRQSTPEASREGWRRQFECQNGQVERTSAPNAHENANE